MILLLLRARICSLAARPLVVRQRLARRFDGERVLGDEDIESGTRTLGFLSVIAVEMLDIGRAVGGAMSGLSFDGGVREREREQGGAVSVFSFVVQKTGIALLGSGVAFFGGTASVACRWFVVRGQRSRAAGLWWND